MEKMADSLHISDGECPPPFFRPFHIYVMEEKDAVMEGQSDNYEMQLYQDYVEREGVATIGDNNNKSVGKLNKKHHADTDSVYEKTKVKHGDQKFYQFSKKIRACPQQCLR